MIGASPDARRGPSDDNADVTFTELVLTNLFRQPMRTLLAALRDRGPTIVLVTHDADVAARADRTIRMLDGRVLDRVAAAA